MQNILAFLLVVFVVGLLEGAVVLGCDLLGGEPLPDWPLWQYLVAPFALGALYLGAEIAFQPITSFLVDRDRVDHPLWKRGLRVLGLILFVCAFAAAAGIAGTWWHEGNTSWTDEHTQPVTLPAE